MNRVAQRPFSREIFDRLVRDRQLILSVLDPALPPSLMTLFPEAVLSADGGVQWHSTLAGQPVSFEQLPQRQAEDVLARLQERLNAIWEVAQRQSTEGKLAAASLKHIKQILTRIPRDALVMVGNEPLILYWASALPGKVAVPLLPLAGFVAVNDTAHKKRRKAWFWWLLLGLLSIVIFALWWFFCPLSPRFSPSLVSPENPSLTDREVTIELPPPKPIDPALLWQPPAIPVAPDQPPSEPTPAPEATPEPEPATKPTQPLAPKQAVPRPPKLPPKKAVTVTNAKDFCAGQRPPDIAPEMVVIFDASGSMKLNIGASRQQERDYEQAIRTSMLLGFFSDMQRRFVAQMEREPTRITVAKNAVSDVLNRLPNDVNVGLVTARSCPRADVLGFYGPSQRRGLISQLRELQPEGGTPLADAVLRAGSMLDGKSRQSTMLVVTDGQESCGGDPCAAARALAAAKSHLKINVVDIGRSGAGACLAQATGGEVYSANSINELKLGLENATKDVQGPADCK